MVEVEFLGPIGREPLRLNANSLQEVKAELQKDEGLHEWLANCAVAVNDKMVYDANFALKSGDRVSLLPPVCGG
ncbi:MoaD/ThiS family protein [uncultured Campylobacter sp.]|uniref:MoaD/ThiS family protein n=1 Tax=uncultured Campylobacter sp. TaxID=218934 RepID=UPI002631B3D6|nr:MoaD/ThiS family protein [uncultured Campylobacter sp.]